MALPLPPCDIAIAGTFSAWRLGTLQARVLPLAAELRVRGIRCAVVTVPWDQPAEAGVVDVLAGVPLFNTSRVQPHFALAAAREQADIIRRLQPRAVHVFKPKGFGALAARFLRDHLLLVDSDDWEGDGGWNRSGQYGVLQRRAFDWQERTLLRDADAVTAAGSLLAHRARALRATRRDPGVWMVPNGLPDAWATELASCRNDDVDAVPPTALLYSRFAELPADWLPRFALELLARRDDVHVVVVGDVPRDVREAVLALPSAARIELRGYLARSELATVLGGATLAVYPYADSLITRAKQSVKLLELLAAGCPIIANDVGDIAPVLGRAGVVLPCADPVRFADATDTLLARPALRREMSRVGSSRVREQFTVARVADALVHCYESMGVIRP